MARSLNTAIQRGSRKPKRVGINKNQELMKKQLLLATAMLLLGAIVQANNEHSPIEKMNVSDQVITFTERGIQFHVFLNGDFDFNALRRNTRYDEYNGRRTGNHHAGLRVSRNHHGKINRIGSVSISYDHHGNVRRIGYVRMKYRHHQLIKIGHLRIDYRYGSPEFYGHVKHNEYDAYNFGANFSIHIGSAFDYNHHFIYGRDFRNNYQQLREDRNYYYYKSRSKKDHHKIIKRRKSTKRKATKRKTLKRNPMKRKIAKTYEKRRS